MANPIKTRSITTLGGGPRAQAIPMLMSILDCTAPPLAPRLDPDNTVANTAIALAAPAAYVGEVSLPGTTAQRSVIVPATGAPRLTVTRQLSAVSGRIPYQSKQQFGTRLLFSVTEVASFRGLRLAVPPRPIPGTVPRRHLASGDR